MNLELQKRVLLWVIAGALIALNVQIYVTFRLSRTVQSWVANDISAPLPDRLTVDISTASTGQINREVEDAVRRVLNDCKIDRSLLDVGPFQLACYEPRRDPR